MYTFFRQEASQMPRIASPLPCWCPLRFITFLFIDSTDATFCRVLENQPVSPSPAPAINPPALFVPQHQPYITSFNIASTACIIHSTGREAIDQRRIFEILPRRMATFNTENRPFPQRSYSRLHHFFVSREDTSRSVSEIRTPRRDIEI